MCGGECGKTDLQVFSSSFNLLKIVNPGSPENKNLFSQQPPSPARSYKIYLQNVFTLGTVEFRQHHASLDGEEVIFWVRLLVGLVCKADEITDEIKVFKDERSANFKFEKFFEGVIVDQEVENFYKKMREKYGTEWIDEQGLRTPF